MAKITPANLAPDAYPRIRGVVITRDWRGLMIAQKWPKKRGTPTNPKVIYTSRQFSLASQMAANSEPMQMETARFMTQGTVWLPRDILVRAAYGNVYELVLPDGTIAPQAYHGPPVAVPPVPVWTIAASATLNSNANSWNGYTIRQRIDDDAILAFGSEVRVTFYAATATAGMNLGKAYIGKAATTGHAYDFASTPTQLSFAGDADVSIPLRTSVVSDPVPFTINPGDALIVSAYYNGVTSLRRNLTFANWQSYYRLGDTASVVGTSGYTTSNAVTGVGLIETLVTP